MVRDRDGNPQKDPLSVHCFCGCSESALLGLGHHFQDQKVKGQGYRGRGMFGGLPHSLLTFIRPRKYFCTDLILDDGPYLNIQTVLCKYSRVIFQSTFSFVAHDNYILKIYSQRIFLPKQLRDQGLPLRNLHTVFQAIVLSRLLYALPAWGPLLNFELLHELDGF